VEYKPPSDPDTRRHGQHPNARFKVLKPERGSGGFLMTFSTFRIICPKINISRISNDARHICPSSSSFKVKTGVHGDGTDCFLCLSEGYTAAWQRKVNFIWLTLSVFLVPATWIAFCYFSLARVVWQQQSGGETFPNSHFNDFYISERKVKGTRESENQIPMTTY